MQLPEIFSALAITYSNDERRIHAYWNELELAYTEKGRYYHNLAHIENLYSELSEVHSLIQNWNAVLFMLFYHDAVYSATSRDNEEKSAELAADRMRLLNVPNEIVQLAHAGILATKSHEVNADSDINLFTDADLSILGAEHESYMMYAQQVRKEYSIYPDLIYRPGRKKVLMHFIGMERIFKTDFFRGKYEEVARKNIAAELKSLSVLD